MKRILAILKDGVNSSWSFTQWVLVLYDSIRHPELSSYPFASNDNLDLECLLPEEVKMVVRRFVCIEPDGHQRQWIWYIR